MKLIADPRKRVRPVAAALLAMAGANALADDVRLDDASPGLMTFPNVSVVSAPAAAEPTSTIGAAGMRAQKDPVTGKLRAPTGAEVAALDAVAPIVPDAQVEVTQMADGTVAAKLNESYMAYSVVSKDASGALVERCVTGESAADHALHNHAAAEEVRHER